MIDRSSIEPPREGKSIANLLLRIPPWLFVHLGWIGGGLFYLWLPYWGFSVAILFFAFWFAVGLTLSMRRAFVAPAAGRTLSPERVKSLGLAAIESAEAAEPSPGAAAAQPAFRPAEPR